MKKLILILGFITLVSNLFSQGLVIDLNEQKSASGNFKVDDTLTVHILKAKGDSIKVISDLATDRWLDHSGNTFLGEDVAGAGNLSHVAGNTGWQNAYIGYEAGYSITTGYSNVFFGWQSGKKNTTGHSNVYLGTRAGYQNVGGIENMFLGYRAGNGGFGHSNSKNTCIGYKSGELLATANNNVFIGYKAGDSNTSGSDNICVGYDIDLPSATASNQMNIGGLLFSDDLTSNRLEIDGVMTCSKIDTIASAATITLGNYNNFVISGTADVDSINTASTLPDMTVIYIEFTGNAAANGVVDGKNLKLSGNFIYTVDDMLMLQRRGNYFFEISESIN